MTALSSILSEIAEQRRKEAEEEDEEDDEDDEDDEDEEYDDEDDTGALGAKTFDDSDLETLAKQVPACAAHLSCPVTRPLPSAGRAASGQSIACRRRCRASMAQRLFKHCR